MSQADASTWWAGLTITEKERVASKVAGKPVQYPECTTVWNSLSDERRLKIQKHCIDVHGCFMQEWTEGNPLTD